MTTTKRILVTATVTAAVIAAVHEWHRAFELEKELQALREQQAFSAGQLEQLRHERVEMVERLTDLSDENAALKDDAAQLSRLREEVAESTAAVQADATETAAQSWLERVAQLKQRMERTPDAQIPELQFVTEQDWLDAAKRKLETEADYRRALSAIRAAAERKVVAQFRRALKQYMDANAGQLPTDLDQLQPYFDTRIDGTILERWEIAPASTVKSLLMGGDVIITQKAPVDDVFDTRFGIGPNGYGSTDFLYREIAGTMEPVYDAYRAAHNGQFPDNSSQLEPYVTTPEQRTAVEKLILRESTSK